MKNWQTVCDPEVARILTDLKELRFLEPFIKRECTLSEAAKELGMKLPALSYRVKRLMDIGLLEVAREEVRRGKRVKLYRSSSPRYRVPFEATSVENVVALLELQMNLLMPFYLRNYARTMMDEADAGYVRIARTEDGKDVDYSLHSSKASPDFVWGEIRDAVLRPDAPALVSMSPRVELDFEDAKALQREMLELYERYSAKTGAQKYLVHLALVPIHEESELPSP